MSLTINHNLMAENVARNLSNHYGSLSTSTQRLSSGMRINSSADDAAGLAVRELMRSDIATMNQGIRNCNDAVSLCQTADGGLQIIDEKLTRMKELAEQAATGTYSSDQRLIIDSEYQAMASEIQRIAVATDFNGIKLLDESICLWEHNGTQPQSTGHIKIHFGTGNSSAEDYYYIATSQPMEATWLSDGLGLMSNLDSQLHRAGYAAYGWSYWKVTDGDTNGHAIDDENNLVASAKAYVQDQTDKYISANGQSTWDNLDVREKMRLQVQWGKDEVQNVADTGDLFNGAVLNGNVDQRKGIGQYALSYYGSFDGNTIYTQQDAQKALGVLDEAMVQVDKNRAYFGATQNRLENTVSNLEIQAENLQAAESQISDTDVASEMTNFVREQILTQSAVAMLSQANSMPKMALQLIQGS